MKNYTITVNGNVYDVTVEEGAAGAATSAPKAAAPKAAAPKAAPKAAAGQGSVKVNFCKGQRRSGSEKRRGSNDP